MTGLLSGLTVLYDADCPLCRAFRGWLAEQPTLVPLRFVAAGSAEARAALPGLDHARTLREITVVGDDGAVWTHERAWVMCLWVTYAHRALAERLATPAGLPAARAAAVAAAGLRSLFVASSVEAGAAVGGGYSDRCAGACAADAQG